MVPPANRPWLREKAYMSALAAKAVRASRPAPIVISAADTSAPSVTSPRRTASTAVSVISASTSSETWPPICRPNEPPAMV
jgi:hypothetical protein